MKKKQDYKKVKTNKELIAAMDEYFSRQSRKVIYKTEYHSGGGIKSKTPTELACEFPTFEEFADMLGISMEKLKREENKHPGVARACERARQNQKRIIITNALLGEYNSSFSQFMLINRFGGEYRAKPVEAGVSGVDINVVYGKD